MSVIQPLRQNRQRAPVAVPLSITAPYGGYNARDPLLAMAPIDAPLLDNWFPDERGVETRPGYTSHATGLIGPVQSLLEWSGASGRKLFAAANGGIYDITAAGAVGAAIATGAASDRWHGAMMQNSAGAFLLAANGVDPVLSYDGATGTAAAITGVDPAKLASPVVWGRRMWFVERGTTRVWYLGTDAIAGAASSLDLGPALTQGGALLAIVPVSFDSAGTGLGEFLFFLGERGDVVAYHGTDPASASTFALAGRFRIAPPIGDRPVERVGPEAYVLTIDGIVPLSAALRGDRSQQAAPASPGGKVQRPMRAAAADRTAYDGDRRWQIHLQPAKRRLVVNAPAAGLVAVQYVLNTQTGAWCTFSGLDASCWGAMGDRVFFGANGAVYEMDTARDDVGAAIVADLVTAWQAQPGGSLARITAVRPGLTSDAPCSPMLAVATGLSAGSEPTDTIAGTQSAAAIWNQFNWNEAAWGDADAPARRWWAVGGVGDSFALRLRVSATTRVRLEGFDLRAERSMHGGF